MTYIQPPWTKDHVEKLLSLVKDGLTARAIAAAMRKDRPNVTRNAVIGKLDRLKGRVNVRLPKRSRKPAVKRARAPGVRRKSKFAPRVITEMRPMESDLNIGILDDRLNIFHCRGIVSGTGPDTIYCGKPVDPSAKPFSYCIACAARYMRPVEKREHRRAA